MFSEGAIFVIFLLICINYEKRIVSSKKIIGGELAKKGEFPFAAAIKSASGNIWSGTIITNKHILTAAFECVQFLHKPYTDDYVYIGSNTIRNPDIKRTGIRHFSYHPKYIYIEESYTANYNVAIITLCNWIEFDANIQPAKLTNRNIQDGIAAVALGFSHTSEDFIPYGNLLKLQTKAYSAETCFSNSNAYKPHFCTKNEPETHLCWGDEGGPLIVSGNVLIGSSSKNFCDNYGNMTWYTNIFECLDYIEAEIVHSMTCIPVTSQVNSTTVRRI